MVKTKQVLKEKIWSVDKNGRLRIIHKKIPPDNNKKIYLVYYKVPKEDLCYGETNIRIVGFTSRREYREFLEEEINCIDNSVKTYIINASEFKKTNIHSS